MLAQSKLLRPRALFLQPLPARAGEALLPALIGELGVGDRDLAAQLLQGGALRRTRGSLDRLVEQLVHRGIDAADEEARDARDAADRLTRRDALFEAGEKGLDHLLVDLLREQQRDVDVDAFGEQLADRRNAGARWRAP